tara:strand:- start:5295 stop:5804 length:510 start_codon:yes stop_codon:yes gene_type:complete
MNSKTEPGRTVGNYDSGDHRELSVEVSSSNRASRRSYSEQLREDHFVEKDGESFAGNHLIIDLWQASNLDKIEHIELALKQSAEICGATLLHIHLHRFTENGGVSGIAVLAESHISIHTWPERKFAALDVFMCGGTRPNLAVSVLEKAFKPGALEIKNIKRGIIIEPID